MQQSIGNNWAKLLVTLEIIYAALRADLQQEETT
jgi:hypothetical protein